MIHTLENSALQLAINPAVARWSVTSRQHPGPALENIQVGLIYRRGRALQLALDRWPGAAFSSPETVSSPHGPLRQISLAVQPPDRGLACTLTFALPERYPFLFWQLVIENRGLDPVYVDRLELLSAGFIYPARSGLSGGLQFSSRFASDRKDRSGFITPLGEIGFFSNGWQSWSYSGAYRAGDRFRRTRLGPIRAPSDVNAGTPQPRQAGLFASDMFGVLGNRSQRAGLLAGFLSQRQHFGSLEAYTALPAPALRLWANGDGARLDPGARLVTDWACLQFLHLDSPDPLGPYLEAVARQNGLPGNAPPAGSPSGAGPDIPTGWCSWYQFSSEDLLAGTVTEADVRANLAALAALAPQLPLEVVQIDDGFASRTGDWYSFSPAFPDGVAPLAAEIRAAGFTPGLWLAPFIVDPRSRLAAEHPDWLLRGRLGRPANAGFLWGAFTTALDLTHPATLDYAAGLVRTAAHDWGYPYLKLDFLYAAALPGRRRDPTRTRAQVLCAGLEALRAAAGPETFLLGCSCPLGPAIGLVDAMRIGTDTARTWHPAHKGHERLLRQEPNLPSARNAVHNSLTRASLHRRWWINDPDCLLLRPGTRLSLDEVRTVATVIALTGGSLLLSDHLPGLPPERLRIAEALLPLIGRRSHLLDWFDQPTPSRLQLDLAGPAGSWSLLALFNWEDRPRDLILRLAEFYLDPQEDYLAREFWRGEVFPIAASPPAERKVRFENVPAHGAVCLAVRPRRSYRPQYLGGNLHISQGLELSAWDWDGAGRLRLGLQRPGPARGQIDLSFPRPPEQAILDGRAISFEQIASGIYRFAVEFNQTAELVIFTNPD
jgi:alpha-galactosidase